MMMDLGNRRVCSCSLAVLLVLLVSAIFSAATAASGERPNVLLICVDDLRPVPGCFGGAARTPYLDSFAETAMTFWRHYVQFPSCGPSRACMLGGVRPDTLGMYTNRPDVVSKMPQKRPTLPLYMRRNGYTTLSFGKVYHGKGGSPGHGWSRQPWHPPSGWTCYVNFKYKGKGKWRPAYEIYDGPDNLHGDWQTADQALRAIDENRDGPFFIAVGFYKPHLPFVAPRRYWDLYEGKTTEPLQPLAIPEGAALYQYSSSELFSYGNQTGTFFAKDRRPTPEESGNMVRAYYSAVSFIDAQIGRLLKHLDELGLSSNTVVVVWSDHGFHLGDQARWAKWTQFEADMRSPLMIRLPEQTTAGKKTDALVESVDIYPTLAEFCGLPLPPHLEGESLLPLLLGTTEQGRAAAFSQVRPWGDVKHLRAYSLRTPTHRYVEWRDSERDYRLIDTELYELTENSAERVNVADDPAKRKIIDACRALAAGKYLTLSPKQ